jgi:cytochrome P450
MPAPLQAVGWALRPLAFLERGAWRYGDAFTLRVRQRTPWVVVSDPAAIKQVFTAQADTQGPSAVEASPSLAPLLGPRSVMLLDEPEHMAHRKLMLPAFHGERMQAYGEMVVEVTRRELESWPTGEQIALWPRMQAISSEVLLRSVFGTASSERLSRLRDSLRALTAWLNDPRRLAVVTTVGPRWLAHSAGFRAAMDRVEGAVLDEVYRRRAHGADDGDDIFTMLEQAYERSGRRMDERELRDELVTLLSDGPTSTSLAWAFERLLRHPEKLERLRAEVLRGEEETYADAVVKETLRLCPVVPLIMRKLHAPLELGEYTVPAGATVAPSPFLVHRREDIYPRARAFVPERFIASSPKGEAEGGSAVNTYAWIPFGGGVRRCLAASFAQLTIKRVMQTVLSEVELHAAASAASSEGAARSSVAFAPDEKALAIVGRRARAYGQL